MLPHPAPVEAAPRLVRLAILDHLYKEVGEQFRAPPLLRQMVRAGKLGKKSGEGFYRWKDGVAEAPR